MASIGNPHKESLNRSVIGKTRGGRICVGGINFVWIQAQAAMGIVAREKAAG